MSQETTKSEQAFLDVNPKALAFIEACVDNYADYYLSPEKAGEDREPGCYQEGFSATFQAGRGSGKTHTLLDLIAISAKQLPRALSAVGSRTFKQVQEIILSQSTKVWEKHGLTEYKPKQNPHGNFVVNKTPPEHFRKAYNSPRSYDNCISFINGYSLIYVAADKPDTQRGLTLDQYFGDESAFTKREFYTKVIVPAVRANKYQYHDQRRGRGKYNHPLHWLKSHFSSAPYSPEGMWIYDNEEKMLAEIKKKGGYQQYFHLEATAYDNKKFLPGNYIEQQKQDLTDFEFQVEIMNYRVKKQPNSFYPALSIDKHVKDFYVYDAFNKDTCQYDVIDSTTDTLKPLYLSWDFNGYFTSAVVAQSHEKEFRFVNEFWAKESETTLVDKVVDKFIDYYRHHIKKDVFLFGDAGGNVKSAGTSETFFTTIKQKLRIAGWNVIDRTESTYPTFKSRYKVINSLLSHENVKLPIISFSSERCKNLVISLTNTRTQKDSFEKDKSREGKLNIAQETVTHMSDAFDYMLYKMFANYIESSGSRGGMMQSR